MHQIASKLWVGGHADLGNMKELPPGAAILNVAHDLWPLITDIPIRYAQVGLRNGVNNPMLYYSAVTQLMGLINEKYDVLCICHSGKHRAPAVAAAYLRAVSAVSSFADGVHFVSSRRPEVVVRKIYEHHLTLETVAETIRSIDQLPVAAATVR